MKPADVIVVGGGPAGSIAALLLARAGVKVRLFERSKFPRRKLCGDTINPGARALLRSVGLEPEAETDALRVDGMIVSGGGTVIRAEYPRGTSGLAITRAVFDARLLARAVREGVEVNEGTLVTGAACDEAGAVIGVRVLHRGGGASVDRASLVIAADGRHSRLAFSLGLAHHPSRPRRWAIGAYYSDAAGIGSMGEMHIRRGDYVGVAAVPGGLTNVCLVTADRARVAAPEDTLRDLLLTEPALNDRFVAARRISPVAVLGPLAVENTACGMNGLLLAGDAAGFIDPMTGDGLRFAIRGAQLAAESALFVLSGGALPGHEHLARRRHEFARKRAFNRALRLIVDSPRAVRAASYGARIAPAILHMIVNVAGDVRAA
jgi:flavin-dependent dehydrogenase